MSEDQTRNLNETLALILDRLTALEAKSYDTKPIQEQALAEIVAVRQEMNEHLARLARELRQLNRKFDEVGRDQYTLRADVRELEDRISGLESRH